MKKIFFIISLILLLQSILLRGQTCEACFYFSEHAEITINKYDKTGNYAGKDVGKITDVQRNGDVFTSKYRVTKYEANGNVKEEGTATVTCLNGNLKIGFQIPEMDGEKPKEASFTYPANMQVGQTLESFMEMHIKGVADGKKMDVYFKVENRKVAAKEKVNTPMGVFDAFKITYDMNVRFKVLGIPIPLTLKIVEWYAPTMGVVKTEAYKDGAIEETSVVNAVKKR